MIKRIFIFSWFGSMVLAVLKLTIAPNLSIWLVLLPVLSFLGLFFILFLIVYYIAYKYEI